MFWVIIVRVWWNFWPMENPTNVDDMLRYCRRYIYILQYIWLSVALSKLNNSVWLPGPYAASVCIYCSMLCRGGQLTLFEQDSGNKFSKTTSKCYSKVLSSVLSSYQRLRLKSVLLWSVLSIMTFFQWTALHGSRRQWMQIFLCYAIWSINGVACEALFPANSVLCLNYYFGYRRWWSIC